MPLKTPLHRSGERGRRATSPGSRAIVEEQARIMRDQVTYHLDRARAAAPGRDARRGDPGRAGRHGDGPDILSDLS